MSARLLAFFAWLTSLWPPRVSGWLARPLAWLIWHLSGRLRGVARVNVGLCAPELSQSEQEQRARRSLYHYACNALEVGVSWYWSRPRFESVFEPAVGMELLDEAMAGGQGVLFLAPHYGAWELLGLAMSDRLGATLYKPGSNAALNQLLAERRSRFGAQLVPANRRGLKALMDQLRAGQAVGVLPDQEPRAGDGRFAPFFGVAALTGVIVPRLLQRTGAKAVFAGCVRLPGGRFQTHILPAPEAIYSDDLDTAIAAVNRGVEQIVALDPEQYLWPYKRFRARPEGECSVY